MSEQYTFKSEVKQLLDLMIHSLYSNKEVFLRELISNASDAIEKVVMLSLTDADQYKDSEFKIKIRANSKDRTLCIEDNGIGMTEEEIHNNLGTIAKSGTKAFLENIKESKQDSSKQNSLIGQFGVGFYSAFIVADKVCVHTKSAVHKEKPAVFWESEGQGSYSLEKRDKESFGTQIILHLKEGEDCFLDEQHLRRLIQAYSMHINYPIELYVEDKKEYEVINNKDPIWTRQVGSISDNEYKEFYKQTFNSFLDPLYHMHFNVDFPLEYKAILYIPSKAELELFGDQHRSGIKIYQKSVFIMEDKTDFLPAHFNFISGVVDCRDLSLNVSREFLQKNSVLNNLKKVVALTIIQELKSLSKKHKDIYETFWNTYGLKIKEGIANNPLDTKNRDDLISLLRFTSSKSDGKLISFEQYVQNMSKDQKHIYYLLADSPKAASNSPYIDKFQEKGLEVVFFTDSIDAYIMQIIKEYKITFDNKEFRDISNVEEADIVGDKEDKDYKDNKEAIKPLLEKIRNYLKDKVNDVKCTTLTNAPAIVKSDTPYSTKFLQLLAAAGREVPKMSYTLYLNPNHELVKKLNTISDQGIFEQWVDVLFDQALLLEKGNLEDPNTFITKINKLLLK